MRKDLLEVGFEENSSRGVSFMSDVGWGIRPSVVILENSVTHGKEQGFENIQLLSILIGSPITEGLRVNWGSCSHLVASWAAIMDNEEVVLDAGCWS
jgi:hypothetical protein